METRSLSAPLLRVVLFDTASRSGYRETQKRQSSNLRKERASKSKCGSPQKNPDAYEEVTHGLSERRACAAVGLDRTVYHYQPRPNRDGPIIKLLLQLAWQRPEQDLGKLFRRLQRMGHG